ncbi:deoxyribonuclease-2-like [Oppia nitens]|uniref:deoxyribonuclease-2-like n=1 Tax=Oppia nitens TaxID=1686743 RepID=UPI0023DA7530|nr:deoxyribonuclease-2-like [Oppia nitens]
MIYLSLLALLAICFIDQTYGQLQCRDESGKSVDWYVVYKFPRLSGGEAPVDTGFHYAFITSESKSGWILSDLGITDKKSIFGQTLQPLYDKFIDSHISYINYNDQTPDNKTTSGGAHAKGVVGIDKTHGFWLIHSVPKFASKESTHTYEYPKTGGRYGQTALCISISIAEVDKVIEQLLYMQPQVYSIKVSSDLKSVSKNIAALENKDWETGQLNVRYIQSTGGVNYTSFSKSPGDHVDLYADIVAPKLSTDLYAETWRQGVGTPLPSECDLKKTVENVHTIGYKFSNSKLSGQFDYLNDHSKWAIGKTSAKPYVCFGDMNRMKSQFKRGGGTTCFETPTVWKNMNEWVARVDKCKS